MPEIGDRIGEVIAPSANALDILAAFANATPIELTPDRRRELNSRPFRSAVSESTPIDWDDTPTINQAVSIAHGHQFPAEPVLDDFQGSFGRSRNNRQPGRHCLYNG